MVSLLTVAAASDLCFMRWVKAVWWTLSMLMVGKHNYLKHCQFRVPCTSLLVLMFSALAQLETVIRWTMSLPPLVMLCHWGRLNFSEPRGRQRSEAASSTGLIRLWLNRLHQFCLHIAAEPLALIMNTQWMKNSPVSIDH